MLAGVLISFRGRTVTLVAADGFRISIRRAELPEPVGAETGVQMIVPARAKNWAPTWLSYPIKHPIHLSIGMRSSG